MSDSAKLASNSKLSSIFEAISLVSITLLLIGFYLYASGSIASEWLYLFGFLVEVGIFGSIAASYREIKRITSKAEATKFRVSRQLVETLIAKQAPSDVIFGLKKMINEGDQPIQGEIKFLKQLEVVLGIERTSEVQPMILKYARVREEESQPEILKQSPVAEIPPAPVQQKAAGAVSHS